MENLTEIYDLAKQRLRESRLCLMVAKLMVLFIVIDGLSEAYPGVANSSVTVHIRVEDWAGGMSCLSILDQLLPILFDSTSDNARRQIFSIDVYNVVDGFNCLMSILFKSSN